MPGLESDNLRSNPTSNLFSCYLPWVPFHWYCKNNDAQGGSQARALRLPLTATRTNFPFTVLNIRVPVTCEK